MSFDCPFMTDNKEAAEAVAKYYDAIGDEFNAKYAREHGDIGDLSTSVWRTFMSDLFYFCDAEEIATDPDDLWTSYNYKISAEKLKACADIAKLMLEGNCGEYFQKAIDCYDGEWYVAPQSTEHFGACRANNTNVKEAIARSMEEGVGIVFDSEDNEEAWKELAKRIAGDKEIGLGDAINREEAIAFAARCMSALYSYEVESEACVLIPYSEFAKMKEELKEFAGKDFCGFVETFLDFSANDAWVISAMAGLSEPLRIAMENGVAEVVAMPG